MNVVHDTEHTQQDGDDRAGLVEAADRTAPRARVPAVRSACEILALLGRGSMDGLTMSEISRELGLSKSTVHGLLATLCEGGFVYRDDRSRRHRLGAMLVSLGRAAARQSRTAAAAAESIAALADERNLTFAVAQVTEQGDAQIIARAYPADDVHVGLTIGSRYGPFDGAIGKCLLAAKSPREAEELARSRRIPVHTPQTIADPNALLREIERVRVQGWAASVRELREHHAVAAPVCGALGDVECILCAVGFPGQLDLGAIRETGERLRRAAEDITRAEGGTPAVPERAAP